MTTTRIHTLFAPEGNSCTAKVVNLSFSTRILCAVLLCIGAVVAAPAQQVVFTTLWSFNGSGDGANPGDEALVRGTDGNFYGTTTSGGAINHGTVFKMTPSGSMDILYSFCTRANCADGAAPEGGLVQGSDGNFYGTTAAGGEYANFYSYNFGTVFRITPAGTLTTLHEFAGPDGVAPWASLVPGSDGNFYGTTSGGGNNNQLCDDGCGTVFRMTPQGALTTLYRFCSQSNCSDGMYPDATLVQSSDGNFYGTTWGGGTNCTPYGCGTIFKITPTGVLTTLYSFAYTDGGYPIAGLVQSSDGDFYGTTWGGGNNGGYPCNDGCGTVFKVTSHGALTTLHVFCSESGCADGVLPVAGLVQGRDGNFYGTTSYGGNCNNCGCTYGCGTVFQMTPQGAMTILHNFDGVDGTDVCGTLIQAPDAFFYGTTTGGGADLTFGTVFRIGVVHTCPTCQP